MKAGMARGVCVCVCAAGDEEAFSSHSHLVPQSSACGRYPQSFAFLLRGLGVRGATIPFPRGERKSEGLIPF